MSKPVIHCLGFFPDYETLFFSQVQSDLFDVFVFNPNQIVEHVAWFKRLPRIFRNIWHKAIIKKYLISNAKTLILMNENRLCLQVLDDILSAKVVNTARFNIHILLRNPYDPFGKIAVLLSNLAKNGVRIWSFDQNDCCRFGFLYYPQFIERVEGFEDIKIQSDFSFVGRDKGRSGSLNRLKTELDNQGYLTNFDIRGPNSRNSKQSVNLCYVDYLEHYLSATCMIEILQEGQYGTTLRPLEALVYGRKLLTNNSRILYEDFYHPNNIMLLEAGELDFNKLEEFMLKPLVSIRRSVIDFHTATGVLHMLFEN